MVCTPYDRIVREIGKEIPGSWSNWHRIKKNWCDNAPTDFLCRSKKVLLCTFLQIQHLKYKGKFNHLKRINPPVLVDFKPISRSTYPWGIVPLIGRFFLKCLSCVFGGLIFALLGEKTCSIQIQSSIL